MAGEAITPLLSAGPFLGIDNTTANIYVSPTLGYSMTAGDCETVPKALIATRGRTLAYVGTLTGTGGGTGTIVSSDNGTGAAAGYITHQGSCIVGAVQAGTPSRYFWGSTVGAASITTNAGPLPGFPFSQAAVADTPFVSNNPSGYYGPYLDPMWIDDYGCQVFTTPASTANESAISVNFTQFDPPALNGSNFTGAFNTAFGSFNNSQAYTYLFTYSVNSTTSSFNPGAAVAGTSTYSGGQETGTNYNTAAFSFYWGGSSGTGQLGITLSSGPSVNTFPNDPTAKYTINLYRASTAQPTYYFVGTMNPTQGSTFTDLFSDAQIANNQQLTYRRDVPPVKPYGDFTNNGQIVNGSFTSVQPLYFPGAPMVEHQERLWYFVIVQNADTGFSGQLQLWYSNAERAWEYDKINNVFLVGLPQSSAFGNSGGSLTNPYTPANSFFCEIPMAMKSLASVMLFWTSERVFILYGNSAATYVFQKFGDIGCSASRSVAYAATDTAVGIFWLSENGIYFTNAQTYNYISEPIRSIIEGLNFTDRTQAVGFFSGHTYYISFPSLGQTWAYRTTTNQWHGPIPYTSPCVISNNTDPSFAGVGYNSVLAVRPVSFSVDSWFSQVDTDINGPQTVTYTSRTQPGANPHIQKEWTHLAIHHKVQASPLICTAKVMVDDDPTKICTVNFDMSQGPTQIATLSYEGLGGGPLRGYVANLTISFTTATGNSTAPIQINNVTAYGKYMSLNLTPTVQS